MRNAWPEYSLDEFISLRREGVTIQDDRTYTRVTVRLHGGGIVPRDELVGREIKTKQQFVVQENDLLVAEIDAKVGGYGIVPKNLAGSIVSGHYFLYDIDHARLDVAFLRYWLKTEQPLRQIKQFIKGSLNYAAIRPRHFPQLKIHVPARDEQQRVAQHIQRVESRWEAAYALTAQVNNCQDELLFSLISEVARDAPCLPLNTVAPIIRRKVETDKDTEYPELGIRSFGKGTFHKPAIRGSELGSKRLYRIEPGDLLFNNVFAWEGAIAVARPEDKNRFGSHRFITCLPDPSKAVAEYLRTWFLTPEGMAEIRAASPGAAGRNRTLNLKKLQAIQVPIPDMPKQRRFAQVYARVQAARRLTAQSAAELEALLPSILDKTFKGEL